MAEQSTRDVVNQELSVGDRSPSDAPATKSNEQPIGGDEEDAGRAEDQKLTSQETVSPQEKVDVDSAIKNRAGVEARAGDANLEDDSTKNVNDPTEAVRDDSHVNGVTASDDLDEAKHSVVDANGGSDTDANRADGKVSEDGKHHTRTNSMKKPAAFKAVSFSKNKFAATKAPGSATPAKASGDKAATATSSTLFLQQGSRPRLVAKSASGLRDSTPKGVHLGDKNGGGAPDASQVWNKNRPTPTPSTKHLTDEELKQQYGIHMTSRLQGDGEGKEAKWADIDDDEDDWAPETIEWNDGTKITLAPTEPVPQPSLEVKPMSIVTDRVAAKEAPRPTLATPTSSVGPNATVLRLGASAERQQAKVGLSLQRGTSDRPTSGVKSPAPVPTKSPWASLPPLEKDAVLPSPPMPPPARPAQMQTQDARSYAPAQIATASPAKEISADDFNRSWRENQPNQPKELYMPNSGRYEAVNESRSRGPRNEGGFRAPSLLQRPSHGDHSSPAEPSAAFQAHRNNTQDGAPWSRRRASSNVSGGSGQYGRRMSVGRSSEVPNDAQQQRRGSQHSGPDRADSTRTFSNSQHTQQKSLYQARGTSPGQSPMPGHAPPDTPLSPVVNSQQMSPQVADVSGGPQEAPATVEDQVVVQKKLMRERIELARQRKREEEEREEAAKKERIRIKLEALTSAEKQEPVKEQPQPQPQSPSTIDAPKDAISTARSPPKPPVPEPSGAPKQYGMMKVHHPETVKKNNNNNNMSAKHVEKTEVMDQRRNAPSPTMETRTVPANPSPPLLTNGIRPNGDSYSSQQPETHQKPLIEEKPTGPWKAANAASEPWARSRQTQQHAPAGGNPWGPLSNNQALGNGTFEVNLAPFPSNAPRGPMGHPDHPPIGQGWSSDGSPRPEASPLPFAAVPRPLNENLQSLPPFASPDMRPAAQNSDPDSLRPTVRPAPIGPPQTQSGRWQASPSMRSAKPEAIAAWNNFHATASKAEREEHEIAQRELAARLAEEARTGIRRADTLPRPVYNETHKQAVVDSSGQRSIAAVSRSNVSGQYPAAHAFGAVGSLPSSDANPRALNGASGGGRGGSRFFPTPADGTQPQSKRAATYSPGDMPRSPSPPPPEELFSHPAFSGDAHRPLVSFPAPKPTVKLPPAPAPPPPATFASMVASQPSYRSSSQPIAATLSWQDRFNALTKTKPASDRQAVPFPVVSSSTREPLDVPPVNHSAAVSLPHQAETLREDVGKVTSKDVEEEEEMFEDREAGSLPLVKVPHTAPIAAWTPAPPPMVNHRNTKYVHFTTMAAIPEEVFEEYAQNKELILSVLLPGMSVAKQKTLGKKKSVLPQKARNPSKNFSRGGKAGKSRESSGTHQPHLQNSGQNSPLASGTMGTPKSGFSQSKGWRTSRTPTATAAH